MVLLLLLLLRSVQLPESEIRVFRSDVKDEKRNLRPISEYK